MRLSPRTALHRVSTPCGAVSHSSVAVHCAGAARGARVSQRTSSARQVPDVEDLRSARNSTPNAKAAHASTMSLPLEGIVAAVRSELEVKGVLARLRVRAAATAPRHRASAACSNVTPGSRPLATAPAVQAELRLAVVTAIDEKERQRGIHGAHPGWQALHGDRDARLVLGLIAEALAVYKLTSTRACLLAESGMVRSHPPAWAACACSASVLLSANALPTLRCCSRKLTSPTRRTSTRHCRTSLKALQARHSRRKRRSGPRSPLWLSMHATAPRVAGAARQHCHQVRQSTPRRGHTTATGTAIITTTVMTTTIQRAASVEWQRCHRHPQPPQARRLVAVARRGRLQQLH